MMCPRYDLTIASIVPSSEIVKNAIYIKLLNFDFYAMRKGWGCDESCQQIGKQASRTRQGRRVRGFAERVENVARATFVAGGVAVID